MGLIAKRKEETILPREQRIEQWGEGPWLDEPDRVDFTYAGLPCLLHRNPRMGNWCGYVAVLPGHALHGKSYGDDGVDVDAHGGLTYSEACSGHICHVPEPGEPDNVWWFGFDCAHSGDLVPSMHKVHQLTNWHHPLLRASEEYRDVVYAEAATILLAAQLAALR